MNYPWQQQRRQQLQAAIDSRRLPHALLLTGAEGMGISAFAKQLTEDLLCRDDQQTGQARQLLAAGTHPDVLLLEPEEEGKQIRVEPVRELINFIHLSSHGGGYKIAIITPADAMTRSAANALLKTLEEPPADSLLLLLSHYPFRLPVTIRSRCQRLHFNPVAAQTALDWFGTQQLQIDDPEAVLDLARGAPLKAVQLHQSGALEQFQAITQDLAVLRDSRTEPMGIAEKWLEHNPADLFQWLLVIFGRMARLKCGDFQGGAQHSTINKDLYALAEGLGLATILDCHHRLSADYQATVGPFNLNKQGVLEDFAVYWQFQSGNHRLPL
ncbi:MAG: DNA polymerase III subunit delta' [Gammaproteobacteria bacterium]